MKYGVIDIGSNTIKAFIYDTQNNLSVEASEHRATKLINYISDGIMSSEGIKEAVKDISELKTFVMEHECEGIFTFATSATRDCINCEEIISEITKETCLSIDVLSGRAEALCDAKAATLSGKEHFLCIDLGGGSAQVCEYKNGELVFAESRPIGALRVKKMLEGDDFPVGEMKDKVIFHIKEQIKSITPSEDDLSAVIMGGASQSSVNIKHSLGIDEEYNENDIFSQLYDRLSEMPEAERMDLLREKAPLRAEILGYALLILDTITSHCKINDISFTKKGSREGYLLYKLEGKDFLSVK